MGLKRKTAGENRPLSEQIRGGPEGPSPRQNGAQTWNCLKKLSRSFALNSWSVRR
jgi:hypothetical protein